MKRKIVWSLVGFVVFLALVLAACAPAATTTPPVTTPPKTTPPTTTPPTTTPPGKEEPTYGGTITFVLAHAAATDYFDPIISAIGGHLASVTYDKLVSADWAKGPAGTNENPFIASNVPEQFRTGVLLESWEVKDLGTMIMHVRKGVTFQNKPPANGRELTADDIIYTFKRGQKDPRNTFYSPYSVDKAKADAWIETETKANPEKINAWLAELKDVGWGQTAGSYMKKTDQWTILYRLYTPYVGIVDGGSWLFVIPRESEGIDLQNWKNACGTGPWIVKDSVSGSSVTWARNTNYWMSDPVHPKNKLPYADTLRGLIIIDESTRLAALRTHKLDVLGVAWDKADGVKKTNPELLSKMQSPTGTIVIFMRTDIAPYKDQRVRQALVMGVNKQQIAEEYFKGNAFILTWPVQPGNVEGYVPLEQLPADVKDLYIYNPDKAKKLLADAGYPSGFKADVLIYQSPMDIDVLQIVKEQWAKIGVDIEVKVVEGATHSSMIYGRTYPNMIYSYWGNASPQAAFGWAHGGVPTSIYNFSKVVDPVAEETFKKWQITADPVARSNILKEETVREMRLAWEVPLPAAAYYVFWAPYLKGYHGELNMGLTAEMGTNELWKFLWIDQALKTQIAGK